MGVAAPEAAVLFCCMKEHARHMCDSLFACSFFFVACATLSLTFVSTLLLGCSRSGDEMGQIRSTIASVAVGKCSTPLLPRRDATKRSEHHNGIKVSIQAMSHWVAMPGRHHAALLPLHSPGPISAGAVRGGFKARLGDGRGGRLPRS